MKSLSKTETLILCSSMCSVSKDNLYRFYVLLTKLCCCLYKYCSQIVTIYCFVVYLSAKYVKGNVKLVLSPFTPNGLFYRNPLDRSIQTERVCVKFLL